MTQLHRDIMLPCVVPGAPLWALFNVRRIPQKRMVSAYYYWFAAGFNFFVLAYTNSTLTRNIFERALLSPASIAP